MVNKKDGLKKLYTNFKFVKNILDINYKYVYIIQIYKIIESLFVLLNMFFIKFIISFIMQKNFNKIIVLLIFYFIIDWLHDFILSYCYEVLFPKYNSKIKLDFNISIYKKHKNNKIEKVQSNEYMDEYYFCLFKGPDSIVFFIDAITEWISSFIKLLNLSIILVNYKFVYILFPLITNILFYISNKKNSILDFDMMNATIPEYRDIEYYNRIFYNKEYNRDIRFYNTNKIFKKIKESLNELVSKIRIYGIRKVSIKNLYSFFINCSNYIFLGMLCFHTLHSSNISDFYIVFSSVNMLNDEFRLLSSNIVNLYRNSMEIDKIKNFISESEKSCSDKRNNTEHNIKSNYLIDSKDLKVGYKNGFCNKISNLKIGLDEKIVLFKGKNGVGKTTLLDTLCGINDSLEGEIFIFGKSINSYSKDDIRDLISIFLQDSKMYEISLLENITVSSNSDVTDLNRIRNLFKIFKMDKIIDLDKDLDRKFNYSYNGNSFNFSNGELQKILLIRTFYCNSKIYILDEPCNHLDTNTRFILKDYIIELSKNSYIFLVSHDEFFDDIANKIIYLGE